MWKEKWPDLQAGGNALVRSLEGDNLAEQRQESPGVEKHRGTCGNGRKIRSLYHMLMPAYQKSFFMEELLNNHID